MSAEQWATVKKICDDEWDATIVKCMSDYIEIPNQSPSYDETCLTNGLAQKAFKVLTDWAEDYIVKRGQVKGAKMEMFDEAGRTPFLIIEVDATAETTGETVMMYGHMDKQPPLDLALWEEGLGPYKPVMRDGLLYGRGGADDGYAICSALLSIGAIQSQGIPHGRIAIVIEGCEESGSKDLPYYMDKLAARIGDINLVVCLDSGALNYEQMWLTTSLRGCAMGTLKVELNKEGIHSGMGGGVIADSFRVARMLLRRIENEDTGDVILPELIGEVPTEVLENMKVSLANVDLVSGYPLLPGVKPESDDNVELALRNWWRSCVTIVGADGLPELAKAGNVLRQYTTLKLSIRCPPTIDANKANAAIKTALETNPPYGAKVEYTPGFAADGWTPPPLAKWLSESLHRASNGYFQKGFGVCGVGGSIPFMGMLGKQYPKAQFVVTGVLGPNSNAHGPNEFLHVPFGKGITYCCAQVLADHVKTIAK